MFAGIRGAARTIVARAILQAPARASVDSGPQRRRSITLRQQREYQGLREVRRSGGDQAVTMRHAIDIVASSSYII